MYYLNTGRFEVLVSFNRNDDYYIYKINTFLLLLSDRPYGIL